METATKIATDNVVDIPLTGLSKLELILKASADQRRLEILQALKHESYGVLELCALFGIKQSAMSHHLKILAKADLITSRREGNTIFYRRALSSVSESPQLISQLFDEIDEKPIPDDLSESIDHIQKARSEQSRQFFSENSTRFEVQQDLIVNINEYRDTLNEILNSIMDDPLKTVESKQALEIGPGNGSYLKTLSDKFRHVIALDNAEPMLQKCRDTAKEQNIRGVGFILGDTKRLIELEASLANQSSSASSSARKADCIVANMVLHHNAKPESIFDDVSKLLSQNGVFIISELCKHDQDWVREAAGDVWLGFDEDLLDQWASNAKLVKGPSSYTALRNGFRIQILSYFNNKTEASVSELI